MSLGQYRKQIDEIDKEILNLFQQRMDVVKKVAEYKLKENMDVLHPQREAELLEEKAGLARTEYSDYIKRLFGKIMELSRDMQTKMINNTK